MAKPLIPGQSVHPLRITGTPVVSATIDEAYDGFTVTSSGGSAHHVFSIAAGALPAGLTLDATTGAVAGTPTDLGLSTGIVIQVTDSAHRTADLAAFEIEVSGAFVAPETLAVADFENDVAELDGAPSTLAALLESDSYVGDGGSLSAVDPGVGLAANHVDAPGGVALRFVGLTLPAEGFTVVVDWSAPATNGQIEMAFYEETNGDSIHCMSNTQGLGVVSTGANLPDLAPGDHKLAFTIIPGVAAKASQDGGAVVVSGTDLTFAVPADRLMFLINGWGADDAVLRSVTVTTKVHNADLPLLSAL